MLTAHPLVGGGIRSVVREFLGLGREGIKAGPVLYHAQVPARSTPDGTVGRTAGLNRIIVVVIFVIPARQDSKGVLHAGAETAPRRRAVVHRRVSEGFLIPPFFFP